MTEREISQILLIRSVEECNPHFFTPGVLLDALRESGERDSDITLIQKRAHYLFHQLPDTLKRIPQTVLLPRKWIALLCILVFFLGIGFNYLGRSDKIHILYNPVVLLVLWNIIVFSLFLIRHFIFKKKKGSGVASHTDETSLKTGHSDESHATPIRHPKPGYSFSMPRWLLRKLWFSLHHQILKKKQEVSHISSSLKITYQYMEHWWDMNQHALLARFARSVHLLAVCLVLGALAGIYIRGLFFVYNVVWKSTFIHDPTHIALILNIIFGLPSQLLEGSLIEQSSIALLTSPDGEPAATWIHIFAVSAFIYVIPERFLLMFLESRTIKTLKNQMTIDASDPYYARYIRIAQEIHASRLQDEISTVVQGEVSKLSESIALYARDRFYDTHIVSHLKQFRNNGGCIRDLEDAIAQQSEHFTVELNSFLEEAQANFKKSLSDGVSRVIGKKLSAIELNVGNELQVKTDAYQEALDGTVTHKITGGIGLAVTAAVAATVGTISGGFGKVLGIAVISTLLHTTGPVGFLIGALAGLLLGGGASLLAKDKITNAVKNQKFPAFSTQIILRESKLNQTIERGRMQVYTAIKTEIEKKLTPHADEITNQILAKIALSINQQ